MYSCQVQRTRGLPVEVRSRMRDEWGVKVQSRKGKKGKKRNGVFMIMTRMLNTVQHSHLASQGIVSRRNSCQLSTTPNILLDVCDSSPYPYIVLWLLIYKASGLRLCLVVEWFTVITILLPVVMYIFKSSFRTRRFHLLQNMSDHARLLSFGTCCFHLLQNTSGCPWRSEERRVGKECVP